MKYYGSLDNNKRNGPGKLEATEYEFEGEFLNDLPNGNGVEIRKKVKYEGGFRQGLYDG